MKQRIWLRVWGTALIVAFYSWAATALNATGTLVTGEMAVKQFDNSDVSFVTSRMAMNHFNNLEGYLPLVAVLLLVAIWWKPVKNLFVGENNNVQ